MRKVSGPNIAFQTQLSELQFREICALLGQKHLTTDYGKGYKC